MALGTNVMHRLSGYLLSVLAALFVSGCASQTPLPSAVKFCADCPEMILLPAGEFMMGDSRGTMIERDRDKGLNGYSGMRTVVSSFHISQFRVTRGDWKKCVVAGECSEAELYTPLARDGARGFPEDDLVPMIGASRQEVARYVKWLSKLSGMQFRLPTSAEWEYAARAGRTGAYYWGADLTKSCDYANIADVTFKRSAPGWLDVQFTNCDDGYFGLAPTNALKPNDWGLYDLFGNDFEMVGSSADSLFRERGVLIARAVASRGTTAEYATMYSAGEAYGEAVISFRLAADVR